MTDQSSHPSSGSPGASELPELMQLELEPHDLDAYLRELAEHARIQEIRTKPGARAHSRAAAQGAPDTAALDPTALARALHDRSIAAVQLVYTLDGDGYCDTLMARAEGPHRLIRRRSDLR